MKEFNINIVYDEEMEELHFNNNNKVYDTCTYRARNKKEIIESIKDYLKYLDYLEERR